MPDLPESLLKRCHKLLAECDEFDSDDDLKSVFVTEHLKPFQTGLPQVDSIKTRAERVVSYLLDHSLADGRSPLVLLLDSLRESHAHEDLGLKLSKLMAEVAAYLGNRAAQADTKRQRRRIDAAIPAQAVLRQHIDLFVQVRFPKSKLLSIADWPAKLRPAQLETQSSTVALNFPVDAITGKPGPIVLQLHVIAPDFKVEGPDQRKVEVPPDKFSDKAPFMLTPLRAGACRVNVEVNSTDEVWLGTLPLEMEVGRAAAPERTVTVTTLVLPVNVQEPASAAARTVVVIPGQATGASTTTLTPVQISLEFGEATSTLQGLNSQLKTFATKNSRLQPEALRQMSWLRTRYSDIVKKWQVIDWAKVPLAQRRDLQQQAAAASTQLNRLSQLLPSERTIKITPELPRSALDVTHSLRGLSVQFDTLKFKK